ncbi:hypothetical protein B0H63DRAFT_33164 [Podospora didyma]|uniref:Uncharacterized protein n=1 Tax=Podospora didyma TaxID=330526 RepID=A0AAE0P680_9PEZI|nr:hypothetical protein B0H63DRAFT_33164 [Podospora didyma]
MCMCDDGILVAPTHNPTVSRFHLDGVLIPSNNMFCVAWVLYSVKFARRPSTSVMTGCKGLAEATFEGRQARHFPKSQYTSSIAPTCVDISRPLCFGILRPRHKPMPMTLGSVLLHSRSTSVAARLIRQVSSEEQCWTEDARLEQADQRDHHARPQYIRRHWTCVSCGQNQASVIHRCLAANLPGSSEVDHLQKKARIAKTRPIQECLRFLVVSCQQLASCKSVDLEVMA